MVQLGLSCMGHMDAQAAVRLNLRFTLGAIAFHRIESGVALRFWT